MNIRYSISVGQFSNMKDVDNYESLVENMIVIIFMENSEGLIFSLLATASICTAAYYMITKQFFSSLKVNLFTA